MQCNGNTSNVSGHSSSNSGQLCLHACGKLWRAYLIEMITVILQESVSINDYRNIPVSDYQPDNQRLWKHSLKFRSDQHNLLTFRQLANQTESVLSVIRKCSRRQPNHRAHLLPMLRTRIGPILLSGWGL